MFKIYSKSCEYVLKALSHIPPDDQSASFSAQHLCAKANVPEPSTRKALQKLAGRGVLKAVPGPGGGYCLLQNPKKTSLYSIILGVDGANAFERCIMGLPQCDHQRPCPIHNSWVKMKNSMIAELKAKSLSDMIKVV